MRQDEGRKVREQHPLSPQPQFGMQLEGTGNGTKDSDEGRTDQHAVLVACVVELRGIEDATAPYPQRVHARVGGALDQDTVGLAVQPALELLPTAGAGVLM